MSLSRFFGLSTTLFVLTAGSVSAEEVTLVFKNSDLTLVGEVIKADETGYVIDTENGQLHVPAAMVSCEGTECPVPITAAEG